MSVKILLMAAASAAAMVAVPAAAVTVFNVSLNSLNEVPPEETTGFGSGTLTLSDDENLLLVNVSFTGLSAPAIEGHLHCCAPLGTNAAVAIPLSVTPAESGLLSGTVDLTKLSSYDAEFLATYGGTVANLRSTVLAGLFAGQSYVNIHTPTFPMGEIRGQVLAAVAGGGTVPEPAQWGLMIAGFTMVGVSARRRSAYSVAA